MAMNFHDIRAYPEKVFKTYWKRMITDPHFQKLVQGAGDAFTGMKDALLRIKTVEQFRAGMVQLVEFLVVKTTAGVSWTGSENMHITGTQTKGAIYISNHRSTSLDPVLFNYMHHKVVGETAYNAAGDNLMNTPWLAHLIRLNRGFVVKRNVEDPDQKIEEAEKLSQYIRSVVESGKSVWIAQGNGRAKDGNDRTDSAVLAMLKMAHRDKSWEEFSSEIPLIPVSVSYEEIPLDTLMVQDYLGELDRSDSRRDSAQILGEISQSKRRIHLHVSPRVEAAKRGDLVRMLDERIIGGLKIWESNQAAFSELNSQDNLSDAPALQAHRKSSIPGADWLYEKLAKQEPRIRQALLKMYAAPVFNRMRLSGN